MNVTKMSFHIPAGFLESVLLILNACECQNILIHLNSSFFFFFLTSNPIPFLPWLADLASYFGMEIVGSGAGNFRLQVTRGEEPAYAVKERSLCQPEMFKQAFRGPWS